MSLAGVATLLGPLGKILEKIIPDPNEARRIQAELAKEMFKADSEFYKAAGSIITAEAQGESWMQRNWRPLTMLTFVFIIANNYILVPYVQFMADLAGYTIIVPTLEIPDGLWTLLQIGIGGYIASRGIEKTAAKVQKGGIPIVGNSTPKNVVTIDEFNASQKDLLEQLRKAG